MYETLPLTEIERSARQSPAIYTFHGWRIIIKLFEGTWTLVAVPIVPNPSPTVLGYIAGHLGATTERLIQESVKLFAANKWRKPEKVRFTWPDSQNLQRRESK
jgi:hypothetical protein